MTRRKASKPTIITAERFPEDVEVSYRPDPTLPLPGMGAGVAGVYRPFQCPGCGAHYLASSRTATLEDIRGRSLQVPFQCVDPKDKGCEYEAGLGIG